MESPEEDRSLDTSLQGELAKGQQRAKERNDNLHTPNRSNHIPISVIELKIAEREILKHVQSQYFKVEGKVVPFTSSTQSVLDHGLIRVGGRLR